MKISNITILIIIILVFGTVGLGVYFANFSFDLRGRASNELEYEKGDGRLIESPYISLKVAKGELKIGGKVVVGVFVKSPAKVAEVYMKVKYPEELLDIKEEDIIQGQELPVKAVDRAGDGEVGFLLFKPEVKREPAIEFNKETQIATLNFKVIKSGTGALIVVKGESGIYGPRVSADMPVVNLLQDTGGIKVIIE